MHCIRNITPDTFRIVAETTTEIYLSVIHNALLNPLPENYQFYPHQLLTRKAIAKDMSSSQQLKERNEASAPCEQRESDVWVSMEIGEKRTYVLGFSAHIFRHKIAMMHLRFI